MSITSPTITPEIARHVLWTFGHEGGYQPGTFSQKLIDLLAYAPPVQMAKLALGYPAETEAVRLAKYDEDGIAKLKAIAVGEASTEETPAPRCPEALFNPDTGDLRRCIQDGQHEDHQTVGGTQWRIPLNAAAEVPFS